MFIFSLTRGQKHGLMVITDIFLVTFSLWMTFALRLNELFWPSQNQLWLFVLAPIISVPVFIKFDLYRIVVRYIGQKGMLAIAQATGFLVLFWFFASITILPLYLNIELRIFIANSLPRSTPILFWMILLLTMVGSRLSARWLLLKTTRAQVTGTNTTRKNVLIYGAGTVGMELASSLSHNESIKLLGIIDDDRTLHGHYIENLEVLGDRAEISKIRATISPLEIFLAIPRIDVERHKELLNYLEDKKVTVRTMPSLNDIASRMVTTDDLRNVDITDLLARKEVVPDQKLLTACVTDKIILVTGAGGSIGSELCRQLIKLRPNLIALFDHSEHHLYKINSELLDILQKTNSNIDIIPILGSITYKQQIEAVIKKFNVNTIYHAAAYKHVTLMEDNILEGIHNNIFGTYNVAKAAFDQNVKNFILISSDKAVRPTSVMGATKRIAEMITQGLSNKKETKSENEEKHTRFIIVRFGNVLGSSGSVIPLFQKQIASGGPITITHPEATRYFMTISEASQLVIQAGSIGTESNIFVLNMGEPVSILALAKQLAYLSGYMLNADKGDTDNSSIEIKYTGLQKGEKIHEELFAGENISNTQHPMIREAREESYEWSEIETILAKLEPRKNLADDKIRQILMRYATQRNPIKPT